MKRPFVTLSFAQSLDGRIATSTGDTRYISGAETLDLAHSLRTQNEAILIGVGTVLTDNPMLNCRLSSGCPSQPIRIVLDRTLRTPLDAALVKTAHEQESIIYCSLESQDGAEAESLREAGVEVYGAPQADDGLDLKWIASDLASRGIAKLFVEGGSAVITSFFRHNMVDNWVLVIAPLLIGTGIASVNDLGIRRLSEAMRFETQSVERMGNDLVWRLLPSVS